MEHASTNNQLPTTGFMRIHQVLQYIPISRSAWWAGVKNGKYPKSIKLAKRITVWRAEDIRQIIEASYD